MGIIDSYDNIMRNEILYIQKLFQIYSKFLKIIVFFVDVVVVVVIVFYVYNKLVQKYLKIVKNSMVKSKNIQEYNIFCLFYSSYLYFILDVMNVNLIYIVLRV